MEPSDLQDNSSSNEPQVIKPESMFNPTVSVDRPNSPPPPAPAQPPGNQQPSSGFADRKKILIVIGAIVGLFILILIIVVITSSGGNKSNQNTNNQNSQSNGILNQPSALDIENANNSISSDITSLNDSTDFPPDNLSDTNLHL